MPAYILSVVYCPLEGEPRLFFYKVEKATEPLGGIDLLACETQELKKNTDLCYFKLTDFEPKNKQEPPQAYRNRLIQALQEVIEKPLERANSFRTIWPNGILENKISVAVIEKPLSKRISSIPALSKELHLRHPGIQARTKNLSKLNQLKAPSECSKEPSIIYTHAATLAGRPLGSRGLPVALYDPHLAVLTDAFANLDSRPAPSGRILRCSMDIIHIGLAFYPKESERESAVYSVIQKLFPGVEAQIQIRGPMSGRTTAQPDLSLGAGVLELKLEMGNAGNPTAQAIADYEKSIDSDDSTGIGRFRTRSVMPMVLMSLASTQLEVCAAVYTDAALVDHLFSMSFHDSVHLEEQVLRLGRALEAIQICLAGLSTYYGTIDKVSLSSDRSSALHLPSPVSPGVSHDQDITTVLNLRFLYKLSRLTGSAVDPDDQKDWKDNTPHGVFVALGGGIESIPEQEVIVKFARRYSIKAHKALATINLAPKLYYHCVVRGGLMMVVMEKVDGTMASLWPTGIPLPPSVLQDVQLAIKTLHDIGLVFGDLRLPNIMVCERDGAAHAVLIDFDWAADAEQGRYPATISDLGVWAPGVEPHGIMQKEHDDHMLKALRAYGNP